MKYIFFLLFYSTLLFATGGNIGGGGGSGNATSIQSIPVSSTPPSGVQCLQSNSSGTQVLYGSCSTGSGTVTTVDTDSTTSSILANTANVIGTTTVTLTLSNQTAHYGLFGPTSGSAAAPTFRLMVLADLPAEFSTNSLTASRVMVTDSSGNINTSSVTTTTLGYLDATSSIQTQLNAKAPLASPSFTGTIGTPLTASRAVDTDGSGNLTVASTTSTELGYVHGVTSAIQTQLSALLPLSGGDLTGATYYEDGSSHTYPLTPGIASGVTCATSATINFTSQTAPVIPVNLTTSDTCVLSFSNLVVGSVWILHINNVTGSALTLPSSVDFGGASYSPGAPGTYDNIGLTVIDSTPHINGSVQGTGYAH